MRLFFQSFILLLLLVYFTSCVQNAAITPGKIDINNFEYKLENIHPTYWQSDREETCFINFWIEYNYNYQGKDLTDNDIEYVRVYLNGEDHWNISLDYIDTNAKKIGNWRHWYWSAKKHVMPLGTLEAVIKLKNGSEAKYSIDLNAPGQTGTDGKKYIYTEDFSDNLSKSTEMLKRATITSESKSSTQIDIDFEVDDSNVNDGIVFFYDDQKRVGQFDINSVILNDGSTNSLSIMKGNITYEKSMSYSDITHFIIVLTDGAQYSNSNQYDCRSWSRKTEL